MKFKLNTDKTDGLECGSLRFSKEEPVLSLSEKQFNENKAYLDSAVQAGILSKVKGKKK